MFILRLYIMSNNNKYEQEHSARSREHNRNMSGTSVGSYGLGYYDLQKQAKLFLWQTLGDHSVMRNLGSYIPRHSAHRQPWGYQPYALATLTPRKISGTHFCQRLIRPQVLLRLERLDKLKKPMTLSGIDLSTFRLPA
jgi:hypothetical protein